MKISKYRPVIWLFGFGKSVGLAIGASVARDANKSFQKRQRQFCAKENSYLLLR